VQDVLPAVEPPARAPAAPAVVTPPTVAPAAPALVTLPTVAPAPAPHGDETQTMTAAFVDDVQQLRGEVARLKQELGQARADSQAAVLWDVDRQVAGIRAQLAQSQAQNDDDSEAARRAAEQRHEAVLTLFAANRRLTMGDSDVLDTLDAAAAALPYPAQTALRNVRDNIESKNLYTARYWMGVAIVESGWSQITH
jgi:hypothetical protein